MTEDTRHGDLDGTRSPTDIIPDQFFPDLILRRMQSFKCEKNVAENDYDQFVDIDPTFETKHVLTRTASGRNRRYSMYELPGQKLPSVIENIAKLEIDDRIDIQERDRRHKISEKCTPKSVADLDIDEC